MQQLYNFINEKEYEVSLEFEMNLKLKETPFVALFCLFEVDFLFCNLDVKVLFLE